MKAFILVVLASFSSLALDSYQYDHSGRYEVVGLQACASFNLKVKCLPAKSSEFMGHQVRIIQGGEKKSLSMCTIRNFNGGIFTQSQFCYLKDDQQMSLSASGSGFRAEHRERESTTYTYFRKTGAQAQMTEGVISQGFSMYYIYTLVKKNN